MVYGEGEMELCPFRICEETRSPILKGHDTIKVQHFMPCIKEKCICYEKDYFEFEDEFFMSETCTRDYTAYNRKSKVEE